MLISMACRLLDGNHPPIAHSVHTCDVIIGWVHCRPHWMVLRRGVEAGLSVGLDVLQGQLFSVTLPLHRGFTITGHVVFVYDL